jgi:hypothetical protein
MRLRHKPHWNRYTSTVSTPPTHSRSANPVVRVISSLGRGHIGDDGVYYPSDLTIDVSDCGEIPFDLTIHVSVIHGRPICRAVEVRQRAGGPQVGRAALAKIPVDRIVRDAVASHAMSPTPGNAPRFRPTTGAQRGDLEQRLRPRRGRKADPARRRELIQTVADMYLELIAQGEPRPKPVIAKQLQYSTAHIGTLLRAARDQGLVGPPPGPGRAGSTPSSRPRA